MPAGLSLQVDFYDNAILYFEFNPYTFDSLAMLVRAGRSIIARIGQSKDRRTMSDRILLGMLTPSSNTVLEPMSSAMLSGCPEISIHFSRFPVTEISTSAAALSQFSDGPMLGAADLLGDAKVQSICWNGTSAGWLGFARDVEFCRTIRQRTGIPATSSVLALAAAFEACGARRVGLVTPYVSDIQAMIVENFAREGFDCVAEEHAGERDNFSFALMAEEDIAAMIRRVAASSPDAITVLCTNLRGARVARTLEEELGIPIFDSVSTAIWGALRVAGADPSRVRGWGRLFALDMPVLADSAN